MASNITSIQLGARSATFADQQVRNGRYRTASDVIEAGLRLLEEKEHGLVALRAAVEEAEHSGLPVLFDIDEFLLDMRREQSAAT